MSARELIWCLTLVFDALGQLRFCGAHRVAGGRMRLPVKQTELATQAVDFSARVTKGVAVQHFVPLVATNRHDFLHGSKKLH